MKHQLDARHSLADNHAAMIAVCPKCDARLFILTFKGIEVDYCDRCRGIWLDGGELEHLVTTGGGPDDPALKILTEPGLPVQPSAHLCPRCDARLEEIVVRAQLTLDRCPRGHGLWFDADELQHLLALTPESQGGRIAIEFLNDIFGRKQTT